MDKGEGSVTYLLAMAIRCRLLAAQMTDQKAVDSLRKLAEEYDEAAQANRELKGFVSPFPIAPPPASNSGA